MPIFLIYNLSGLIVGVAGAILGLAVMLAAGRLSAGLLAMAATWLVVGLWWRRQPAGSGEGKRPYPALFFIPLPFASPVLFLLAAFGFIAENYGARNPADPRAARLRDDVRSLAAAEVVGDDALSREIRAMLVGSAVPEAKAESFHVFTRVEPNSVLVLVQAPNLKKFAESARVQLLRALEDFAESHPRLRGKSRYIGIRGKLAFGAILSPPDLIKTGTLVADTPLLPFYEGRPNAGGGKVAAGVDPPSNAAPPMTGAFDALVAPVDPIAKALADLASRDILRVYDAVVVLKKATPEPSRRAEVVAALADSLDDLKSKEIPTYNLSVDALIAWGEPADVIPILAKLAVIEKPHYLRAAAIGLGAVKAPAAAEALAKLLASGDLRTEVIGSLQEQGAAAEPFVLPLLQPENTDLRDAVCKVLWVVGGEDSIRALELLPEAKPGDSQAVRETIEAIRKRLNPPSIRKGRRPPRP